MQFNIPIYSANITINRFSLLGNRKNKKILETLVLKNHSVKGFTIIDIMRRKQKSLFEIASKKSRLNKDQFFEIKEIE